MAPALTVITRALGPVTPASSDLIFCTWEAKRRLKPTMSKGLAAAPCPPLPSPFFRLMKDRFRGRAQDVFDHCSSSFGSAAVMRSR